MRANNVMRFEVVTVPPDLSVETAHKLMVTRGLRHLPVVSGSALAGMVSDRDLLLVIGRGEKGRFVYPQMTVGEVMSLAPVSAGPNASVRDLAKAMVESKIDAIPIITSYNELVGLVTSTDLMLLLTELPGEAQPAMSFQLRRAADLPARA
jgi:acetoin utilization protein AcuB